MAALLELMNQVENVGELSIGIIIGDDPDLESVGFAGLRQGDASPPARALRLEQALLLQQVEGGHDRFAVDAEFGRQRRSARQFSPPTARQQLGAKVRGGLGGGGED